MLDYFSILGLPRRFDLDGAELEQRYFALQRECHPDRVAAKPPFERAAALQRSIDANAAYETLKSPLKRARHLLELTGRPVLRENGVIQDPSLLMEIMEWREKLEEAQAPSAVFSALEEETEKAESKLSAAFAGSDLEAAHYLTLKLMYLDKIRQDGVHFLLPQGGG